jgi:hypothetical protein
MTRTIHFKKDIRKYLRCTFENESKTIQKLNLKTIESYNLKNKEIKQSKYRISSISYKKETSYLIEKRRNNSYKEEAKYLNNEETFSTK